jgi:hypothetical protein
MKTEPAKFACFKHDTLTYYYLVGTPANGPADTFVHVNDLVR